MNWELILKTISALIVIKAIILILFPQQIINITKKRIKNKQSLRKTALIYLVAGLIVYAIISKLF